jgi:hypothetical protein
MQQAPTALHYTRINYLDTHIPNRRWTKRMYQKLQETSSCPSKKRGALSPSPVSSPQAEALSSEVRALELGRAGIEGLLVGPHRGGALRREVGVRYVDGEVGYEEEASTKAGAAVAAGKDWVSRLPLEAVQGLTWRDQDHRTCWVDLGPLAKVMASVEGLKETFIKEASLLYGGDGTRRNTEHVARSLFIFFL